MKTYRSEFGNRRLYHDVKSKRFVKSAVWSVYRTFPFSKPEFPDNTVNSSTSEERYFSRPEGFLPWGAGRSSHVGVRMAFSIAPREGPQVHGQQAMNVAVAPWERKPRPLPLWFKPRNNFAIELVPSPYFLGFPPDLWQTWAFNGGSECSKK